MAPPIANHTYGKASRNFLFSSVMMWEKNRLYECTSNVVKFLGIAFGKWLPCNVFDDMTSGPIQNKHESWLCDFVLN